MGNGVHGAGRGKGGEIDASDVDVDHVKRGDPVKAIGPCLSLTSVVQFPWVTDDIILLVS